MIDKSLKKVLANLLNWTLTPWIKHGTSGLSEYYIAERTDTGVRVGFGIGDGGTNHGVWSWALEKWLIYGDTANNVAHVPNICKVVAFTSAAQTQNAGAGTTASITITAQPGYTFVGIVGFTSTHNQASSCGAAYKTGNTAAAMATTNRSSSKWTDQKCTVYVLFVAM